MRLLVQRVKQASVSVEGTQVAQIGRGICAFLGVARGDCARDCAYLAHKLLNLRIFPGAVREFDRSVLDIVGEILVVSQFTLCADTRAGRRPSLSGAAPPEQAEPLYASFVEILRSKGARVQTGRFQEHMDVALSNDGPVTFIIDSP